MKVATFAFMLTAIAALVSIVTALPLVEEGGAAIVRKDTTSGHAKGWVSPIAHDFKRGLAPKSGGRTHRKSKKDGGDDLGVNNQRWISPNSHDFKRDDVTGLDTVEAIEAAFASMNSDKVTSNNDQAKTDTAVANNNNVQAGSDSGKQRWISPVSHVFRRRR